MLNKPSPISQDTWDSLKDIGQRATLSRKSHILELDGLTVDLTHNMVCSKAFEFLSKLSKESQLKAWREKLFTGDIVNKSENRAANHPKCRDLDNPTTQSFLNQASTLYKELKEKGITDIINLGIGGSFEGPRLVCNALSVHHTHDFNLHFVANIDAQDIIQTLEKLNPETTLFIISSKSFSTLETFSNAEIAKEWIGNLPIQDHFIAITTAFDKAKDFGLKDDYILEMDESIGGRYSLWSAIGLSIIFQVGIENFKALLKGAAAMDNHFRHTPLAENIPVILALYHIFYRNFVGCNTRAIAAYDQRLKYLTPYIQQLEMESCGKSFDQDGQKISYPTSGVVFGGLGSNIQHSFLQMMHQGHSIVPVEFIASKTPANKSHKDTHKKLLANMIAQSKAFAEGENNKDLPHKHFDGGRPSTLIVIPEISPYYLGMLLALYEHKVFCQSVVWNINAFDQWGVELGKKLANDIISGDVSLPSYLD